MDIHLKYAVLIEILAPLCGALFAGFLGPLMNPRVSHRVTIGMMAISFVMALFIFKWVVFDGQHFTGPWYTWMVSGHIEFHLGFLIDTLAAMMMLTVTFVSGLVHIYSIGYMKGDPGYQRFFAYVSFFTFMMLLLVSADNFLQLFLGWEGVGLVSYWLISFWYQKQAAIDGGLKSFLVNRVGDFGFILGLAIVLSTVGSLNYNVAFAHVPQLLNTQYTVFSGHPWSALSVMCFLLFIGAMGKSAQIPLHVWLPESMQGPTPISALIHAATMVTAGVYMVARLSPLFEFSQPVMTVILVIGASGALYLGLLAFVNNDVKRIIAYSTMSQLGYMMAANGASAFSAGLFHLFMHACFKALLFLCAGSVLVIMQDEHDIRKMGGLWRYMPITYVCFLIGALSLAAIPPFSGFYSKDVIIEAVHIATIPGASYAYVCLLLGSFVTAFYIFRQFWYVFHGRPRMEPTLQKALHEAPWTMTLPQILLAIPSIVAGALLVGYIVYSIPGWLGQSIFVLPQYDVLTQLSNEYQSALSTAVHAFTQLPFWFSVAGILVSWIVVIGCPQRVAKLQPIFSPFAWILKKQFGFDAFNRLVFVKGGLSLSQLLFKYLDERIIDRWLVGGTGRDVLRLSKILRRLQSGYVYHYVFVMVLGLVGLLAWMFFGHA